MKLKYYFPATAIIGAIFFTGCEKDSISYGTVNVSVTYQNKTLPQAKVYLKQGTISNPNIPLSQYDAMITADVGGLATFAHLIPDGYFFYAQGFSVDSNRNVSGPEALKCCNVHAEQMSTALILIQTENIKLYRLTIKS